MSETRINVSELKSEESALINELAEFIKEKTKAEVEITMDSIIVKGEGKNASRKYLRVLLRRFLHKKELRDYFRVIGEEEKALMVKKKKIEEE
jgi:hypothetical protein